MCVQGGQEVRERLEERVAEGEERGRAQVSLQTLLTQTEEELERERGKVRALEGELATQSVVKEGLERGTERENQFYQKLSRALKLDSTTAQVLTGDFARDAILVRAEQIAKHEVEHTHRECVMLLTDTDSGREAVSTLFCPEAAEELSADTGEQGGVPGSVAEEGQISGGEGAGDESERDTPGKPSWEGRQLLYNICRVNSKGVLLYVEQEV